MPRIPLISLGSVALLLLAATTRADISGFGNFSNFSINVNDSDSAPTLASGLIHLTNNGSLEGRSVIDLAPQAITQFTASFTYQNTMGLQDDYGATFVLENANGGASAVGGGGGFLGYGQGIGAKSAAVTLEMSPTVTTSGYYTNGTLNGGGSLATTPVAVRSGDPINVTLAYSGSTLTETLADPTANTTYTNEFFVGNLATVLGAPTAFVGITASSNNPFDGTQTFSNFQFTSSVPEPASLSLLALVGFPLLLRRRSRGPVASAN